MSDKANDLSSLKSLGYGDKRTVHLNWFEGGGCIVDRVQDVFVMHEVPQYEGMPQYVGTYPLSQLEEMLEMAYSLT